jgi:hypothetical protein
MQSKNENTDGVAFVSGMQGAIVTTFTVEVGPQTRGVNNHSLVSGCVAIVIHTEAFMRGVTTQN